MTGSIDMARRAELVAELEQLLGTPWVHGQRSPGVAMDCITTIAHAVMAIGIPVQVPEVYTLTSQHGQLEDHVAEYCDPIELDEAQPGDLVTLWVRAPGHVHHLGALIDPGRDLMFHSHAGRTRYGRAVIEPMGPYWHRRVSKVWRIRGLD